MRPREPAGKDSGFNFDTLAAGPATLDRRLEVVLAFLQNSDEEAEVLTPSSSFQRCLGLSHL